MFIGHFAVAMAAKRAAPRTSLGWLFAASQFPDLLWPVFLLTGIERARIAPGDTAFTPLAFEHYPWSHSLLMVVIWGALLGGAYRLRRGDGRASLVIALLVVSHWVLDWVTHRPDLPLVPGGGPKLGLGLWNHATATLVIELLVFAGGVWVYARSNPPRDRTGRWAFVALIAFLVFMHATNAVSPPPPNITAVAIAGLAIWLLVWWAAWADRHRGAPSS
jgi:hypothetical protein